MRLSHVLPLGLAALCSFAAPAMADEYIGFRSPTGNIHCAIYTFSGQTEARCDMMVLTRTYKKRPAGCDLEWGNTFIIGANGKGQLGCVGDSMNDASNPVLGYGRAVSLGGISCVSAKTGMTCTNAAGHGFAIAKAKQRIF